MNYNGSNDAQERSQTIHDRFSEELGALIAHVYLKLKQDFPELFTIRDLKRATEALVLFLDSGLSEKDAFVAVGNYAFAQIQLEEELTDMAWTARQAAVVVLATLYGDRIAGGKNTDWHLLETLLRDDAWAVRQATVEALSNIYPTLIQRDVDVDLKGLEAALKDRSWVVRKATVNAL